MKLLHDRILVKKIKPAENKTGAGIILTSKSRNEDDCEVILTGPDCKNVKPGNVIRKFQNSQGIEINYNGEDCLILIEGSLDPTKGADIEFVHKD